MKVLVTGRNGQVARCLAERAAAHPTIEWHFLGRPILDLEDDVSVRATIRMHRPDVVVNAAAYTAVDQAEQEEDLAYRVNGSGPGILAKEVNQIGGRIIHLSTDYVFDGTSPEPYDESAAVGPISVYGRSKLAGERAVIAGSSHCILLRTAWVYSPFGKNFVRTILRLAQERDVLSVVADQIGTPTSAFDIADGICAILNDWKCKRPAEEKAIYHLAGRGETSWAGLARHVLEKSKSLGAASADVREITTEEFPTPAKRPRNSRLNSENFERRFRYTPRCWKSAAADTVARLINAA